MPVVEARAITPLSSMWTVARLIAEIRTLTNELDNARIQDTTIRNHLNSALTNIADLLNSAEKPDYGVVWRANLEAAAHPTGLAWIDLSTPVSVVATNAWERGFNQNSFVASSNMIPSSHLWGLSYVTAKAAASGQNDPTKVWKGNCQSVSISEVATLDTGLNDQYRQSICYHHHGHDVLFHFGSQITSAPNMAPDNTNTYYERPKDFNIWGYRQPLLDNLEPESSATSSWKKYVDLPDKHMRLLLLFGQKMVLEQLKKEVDSGIEQQISTIIQQIQGTVQTDVQKQISDRINQKQGFSTR